jgi:sulfur carrier protein
MPGCRARRRRPARWTSGGLVRTGKTAVLMNTASSRATARLTLNGEPFSVAAGTTVAALLTTMDTAGKRVAVERNGEIVPRSLHDSTVLAEGDRLEIVVAVGGG